MRSRFKLEYVRDHIATAGSVHRSPHRLLLRPLRQLFVVRCLCTGAPEYDSYRKKELGPWANRRRPRRRPPACLSPLVNPAMLLWIPSQRFSPSSPCVSWKVLLERAACTAQGGRGIRSRERDHAPSADANVRKNREQARPQSHGADNREQEVRARRNCRRVSCPSSTMPRFKRS